MSLRSMLPKARTWLVVALIGLIGLMALAALMLDAPQNQVSEAIPEAAVTWSHSPVEARSSSTPEPTGQGRDGSIAGHVRTAGGEPVGLAGVCAWSRPFAPGGPSCVRASADGRYVLDGLAPGRFRLVASANQHLPSTTGADGDLTLTPGQALTNVDFELRPGGVEVRGVVMDELGGPVEGARVWGTHESQSVGGIVTDMEGRFSAWVAPGGWQWHAIAADYTEGRARTAAPGHTIRLTLTPESVIEGRVIEAGSGRALAGVVVVITEGPTTGLSLDPGTVLARDVSDERGRFRLDGLLPGRYKPVAIAPGARGEPVASVRLGLAEHVGDLVIEMHPSATLAARVLRGDSELGCEDGSVLIRHREG